MAYSQGRLQTHTPFWVRLDYSVADVNENGTISHASPQPLERASIDIRFSTFAHVHAHAPVGGPGVQMQVQAKRTHRHAPKVQVSASQVHLLSPKEVHCGDNSYASRSPNSMIEKKYPTSILLKTEVVPSSKKRISQLLCDNTCTSAASPKVWADAQPFKAANVCNIFACTCTEGAYAKKMHHVTCASKADISVAFSKTPLQPFDGKRWKKGGESSWCISATTDLEINSLVASYFIFTTALWSFTRIV